jgi:hypothetical protein
MPDRRRCGRLDGNTGRIAIEMEPLHGSGTGRRAGGYDQRNPGVVQNEYGLKRVQLVDYQTLDDHSAPLAAMLWRELEICRREGVHILEDVGCSVDEAAAPRRRQLQSWRYYYKASDAALRDKLKNPASWRPSMFEGDSTL